MALDGVFLHHMKNELAEYLIGTRVDKIYQPNKDEIILTLRSRDGNYKLLMSARANSPRINLIKTTPENPQTPPMLCMLLRKRLTSARLRDIRQPQLERILFLDFDSKNELGDDVSITLVMEIMGQYSNIILVDQDNKIVDALKRVDASMTSQRLVLPGMEYAMPPSQNKLSMLEYDSKNITDVLFTLPKNDILSKGLMNIIQGISPIISRELEYLIGKGKDVFIKELTDEHKKRLFYFLDNLVNNVRNCDGSPYMVYQKSGKPMDISFMDICQYENGAAVKKYDTFSELLEGFYSERDTAERMKAKSQDLLKLITNIEDRLSRKINTQYTELEKCANRETLRIYGDLLQANIYAIKKGAEYVEVQNYYDENMPTVKIKLNPALTPSQNSQKYYKEYRKAKTAEDMLTQQIEKAKQELVYINSVFDSLTRATTERELAEIREELYEQGYIKNTRNRQKLPPMLPPLKFISKNGFTILVGRNNKQNDKLTLKQSAKNDIWFHTKNIPGSHTVIVTDGKTPDDDTIAEAAAIAAKHSKAKGGGKVPVDYTQIRYVSKPQGAKPGMVIYVNYKTVYVDYTSFENIKSSTEF